ncbi:hypothetical protein PIB30_027179 [Stylosanthes scabra]|uniref:Uncharacterized protein n=1 Tax=Stylosanthes scabra TaxID=79078 RepID=A0ABU6RBB7_9FABA|nr:hypothetical protein [Stylosanthes scabra]
MSGGGCPPWKVGLLPQSKPPYCLELALGERGDVHQVQGQDSVLRLSTTLVELGLCRPSLLHSNAWSAIRCFELVTEFLLLPQDPESSGPSVLAEFEGDGPLLLEQECRFRHCPVEMAGNGITLARLRSILRSPPAGAVPTTSGPSSVGRAPTPPITSAAETQATPERGSSSDGGRTSDQLVNVSSAIRDEEQLHPPTSPKKRPAGDSSIGA